MNAAAMVTRCFERQHPEWFGRPPIKAAILPVALRYGHDDLEGFDTAYLPEEPMGLVCDDGEGWT